MKQNFAFASGIFVLTLWLHACSAPLVHEPMSGLDSGPAQSVVLRAFEGQDAGLRPLSVAVDAQAVRLTFDLDGRQSSETIYYRDIQGMSGYKKSRVAVILSIKNQTMAFERKLEFADEQKAFEFMDAVNSLKSAAEAATLTSPEA